MMRAFLAGLCAVALAGSVQAAPFRVGMPLGDPHRFNSLYTPPSAGGTLPCSVQNNGVSPSICMDFVNSSYTNTLTTDTGVHSGAGVTCTGTQLEQFTGTFPTGNLLVVVDATYPASASAGAIAFQPQNASPSPTMAATTAGVVRVTGGTYTSTARTGSVEIAAYWDGTTWIASFAGDATVSIGSTAPFAGSQRLNICNGDGPLTTAFRSLRVTGVTLTSAQVQAAALQ